MDSAIRLQYARRGRRIAEVLDTAVVRGSSAYRGWRARLAFEIHRMSDGASNAPRWRGELTFATVAIEPAMIESLLDAPADEVFPKRHCVDAATALSYAHALSRELVAPTEPLYTETLCNAFVLHLLAVHGRGEKPELAPKGKLAASRLRAAIELVHEQLAAGLSLETMASAAGYSPFQFARLFKATTGLTPHRFVLGVRLERARRLLATQSAAAVALQTGFYDQAHFTNAFGKAFGVTPATYKRRIFQASAPPVRRS
jgi:AraC family transcriptional regulator